MYGCEVEGEVYEFEGDSLSQVDCIESLNEIESVFKDTFDKLMEMGVNPFYKWADEMSINKNN
jgi:gamma-glutamylcyclotransferase (GGCT)/AIG2-like uncharacterized protein YtfP